MKKIKYIYEFKNWPEFSWHQKKIAEKLAIVRHRQGRWIGQMESLGFAPRAEAFLQSLTEETVKTSEIEGEKLDRSQVRSSIARRLGMEDGGLIRTNRNVEGIVEIMVDATQNYNAHLTRERLFGWHSLLFPTGRSGMNKIRVGKWRDDKNGPMQIISGPVGRNKVHFEAPAAELLNTEMKRFLVWFNAKKGYDEVLKAGIAHLWFVTLHPFEDGNGRIARMIADMALARSEKTPQRFYSMSAQISLERKVYYNILESTQKGSLDIREWLEWFLDCLSRAFRSAESTLDSVFKKTRFWEIHREDEFNARQKKVLNRLLEGFEGKLTSSKWAALAKCSQDTANRDIGDLLERKFLSRNPGGGRSTSYSLRVG